MPPAHRRGGEQHSTIPLPAAPQLDLIRKIRLAGEETIE